MQLHIKYSVASASRLISEPSVRDANKNEIFLWWYSEYVGGLSYRLSGWVRNDSSIFIRYTLLLLMKADKRDTHLPEAALTGLGK